MFFRKAFNGFNDWWRFVIVLLAIMLGHTIGQIPLYLALDRSVTDNDEINASTIESFAANPDFSVFGINSNMGFALLLMMFVGAFTAFFFIFKPIHQREFRTLVSPTSRIKSTKIFFAFFLWLALSLGVEIIAYFLHPESYTFHFKLNTFIPLVFLSILLLPVQTSLEELIFRGYLLQGIATKKVKDILAVGLALFLSLLLYKCIQFYLIQFLGHLVASSMSWMLSLIITLVFFYFACKIFISIINKAALSEHSWLNNNFKIIPLVITSILFGLIHSMNPEIEQFGYGVMQFYYISAGLALGLMTIMDDGLELALGVHAATNITGAVFVGYDGAAIQTDALLKTSSLNPYLMITGFFFVTIIFMFVVSRKYEWESFRKIFSKIDQTENFV